MRFLANENVPSTVVQRLRQSGHDVLAVKEVMRGADDPAILARGVAESRILISQDKDFGELAFRTRLPASCGVILFRLNGLDPDSDCDRMVTVINSRSDWAGAFSVVDETRIRVRSLPHVDSPEVDPAEAETG